MTDQQRAAADAAPGPAGGHGGPREGTGGPLAGGLPDAAAAQDPAEPTAPSKFRRDRRHKMLGGVCAGLGRQCDMDPVIFRIGLAVLAVTGGIGLIFYGFAWLFVPFDEEEENEARRLLSGRVDGPALTAVLCALVGCGLFLSMLSNGGLLTFAAVLALLLAGAGYWSAQRGTADADPLAAQAVADAPPEAQAPPVAAPIPSWWRDPIVKDGTHVGGTGYLWGPPELKGPATEPSSSRQPHATSTYAAARPPQPSGPRGRGSQGPRWIGGWVFLLALAAGALGTGLTWDDHALVTSLQTGLAGALTVFALGITVSAFVGRTGVGSILLAVVTAGLLAMSAALPKDIDTNWVRTEWAPATVAKVQPAYALDTGVGTLDLSRVDVGEGETLTTRAELGMGRIEVVVPPDATVKLHVEVGIGDIQLPGEAQQDVDIAPGKEKTVTLDPPAGSKDGGTVDLRLEVGVGQAEVARAAS
ncbi:PspC domain-containing protein [Streptomyces himalayensis]|uniref:PspC domain-containing protein n=1 Tax=Streptomyces himalayensis subsp. himalayensis TaxID=2756131 RepID=A0A7W0DPQ0_9ACTN|nr:PspC domain-containing protein [Streptomyces himalayensis]MBA2948204.1 PspC domain-containing protein [Streptomyces himalayensis subsp. himalayensis]